MSPTIPAVLILSPYGVTTNHVLGVEVVLHDGQIMWFGGLVPDTPGYDLCGIIVGSEGTMGIVTKVAVRLMRARESVPSCQLCLSLLTFFFLWSSKLISRIWIPVGWRVGQGEGKRCADSELALDADVALHQLEIFFDDVEPQAEAIEIVRVRLQIPSLLEIEKQPGEINAMSARMAK